jgi:hypothetical protein
MVGHDRIVELGGDYRKNLGHCRLTDNVLRMDTVDTDIHRVEIVLGVDEDYL